MNIRTFVNEINLTTPILGVSGDVRIEEDACMDRNGACLEVRVFKGEKHIITLMPEDDWEALLIDKFKALLAERAFAEETQES